MSEIKGFKFVYCDRPSRYEIRSPNGGMCSYCYSGGGGTETMAFNFLQAAQSELAALQEDLTNWKTKACESAERESSLREELEISRVAHHETAKIAAAAEQRNATITDLMDRVLGHFNFWKDHPYAEVLHGVIEDYQKIKPTESGARERADPRVIDALKEAGFLGSKC